MKVSPPCHPPPPQNTLKNHTYTHLHIHTHTDLHMDTQRAHNGGALTQSGKYTDRNACTARKTQTHTYTHIHMHACMHAHAHTFTNTHTHTHTHTHTFTNTHTHTHTHTHTRIQTHTQLTSTTDTSGSVTAALVGGTSGVGGTVPDWTVLRVSFWCSRDSTICVTSPICTYSSLAESGLKDSNSTCLYLPIFIFFTLLWPKRQ